MWDDFGSIREPDSVKGLSDIMHNKIWATYQVVCSTRIDDPRSVGVPLKVLSMR